MPRITIPAGDDINAFVVSLLGRYHPCADMDHAGWLTLADVYMFINRLLNSADPC